MHHPILSPSFFVFQDTATTEIYTLSLHDALPITAPGTHSLKATQPGSIRSNAASICIYAPGSTACDPTPSGQVGGDRKSTRLNSSHVSISYAVFCLKKKTNNLSLIHARISHSFLL